MYLWVKSEKNKINMYAAVEGVFMPTFLWQYALEGVWKMEKECWISMSIRVLFGIWHASKLLVLDCNDSVTLYKVWVDVFMCLIAIWFLGNTWIRAQ